MSIESKEVQIIDLNLFSGSSDLFRTTLGGYFQIESGSAGEIVELIALSTNVPPVTQEGAVDYGNAYAVIESVASGDAAGKKATTYSSEVLAPNEYFPVELTAKNLTYKDDNWWKIYWTGGTFGEDSPTTYTGIYNENIYSDYWFNYNFPYSKKEIASLVEGTSVVDEIEISYDYNFYLKEYQDYIDSTESELLIPNMYLIAMLDNVEASLAPLIDDDGRLSDDSIETARRFPSYFINFVGLEGNQGVYDTGGSEPTFQASLLSDQTILTDLFITENGQVSGRGTGQIHVTADDLGGALYELDLHKYLSGSIPVTSLSSSTISSVQQALENIMFDQQAVSGDLGIADAYSDLAPAEGTRALFPYYVKINFTTQDGGSEFVSAIEDKKYSSKILMTLKEIFNEENDSLIPQSTQYVISQDYMSSSIGATANTQILKAENVSLRSVNYLDFLAAAHDTNATTTQNFCFVGPSTISRVIATDTTSAYRSVNAQRSLSLIQAAVNTLITSGIDDPMGLWELFDSSYRSDGKYNETIAYRIEKIGASATGDSRTRKPIQNFWVFNSSDLDEEVNLCDSQIKYGQDYTYNVYAYVVVAGSKYKMSDLALTRQINFDEDKETYCLEWYDPTTDEGVHSPTGADLEAESSEKAKAAFNIQWQSSLNLFEIPIYTQEVQVTDHPPNQLNLDPFFHLDNSQTIGYNVSYETFMEKEFPLTITASDKEFKEKYLNSNNIPEGGDLTIESRSQQRYLQVYRLSEMPTAYTDFDENLISTIDLLLEDSIYTLPDTIFYDKINTNQKYYYVFRVLNENMVPGQLSEIYEAELVNDGGYTYGMFDILFEDDLEIDNFINPSEAFKKLLQLQPSMSQIAFQDEDVDYSQTAASQLNLMGLGVAEEPLWDKTFKIRLTSKKTGRKIDLNVSYKYAHDSN